MSQGDIEKRTRLLRCYISRVENGHTVPAIETLEKMARAMEVPMYVLFYDGEKPPKANVPEEVATGWGSSGREAKAPHRLRGLLSQATESDGKFADAHSAEDVTKEKTQQRGVTHLNRFVSQPSFNADFGSKTVYRAVPRLRR